MTSTSFRDALDAAFLKCRNMDASLSERLAAFGEALRKFDPSYADAVARLIDHLQERGAGASAPGPGDTMPDFLLPDDTGKLVGLEQLLVPGPVALAFHRGHWCPYCRINADALAKAQAAARADGAQIVAITPERQEFSKMLKPGPDAPIPVLIDMDNGYALSLDLVFWVGEEMMRLMAAAGRDLSTYQGNESWLLPIPATFVVGQDGVIKERFLDPDYRKRMAIEDLLEGLKRARQDT